MLALKKIGLALFVLNLVGMVVLVSMLNKDSHTSYSNYNSFAYLTILEDHSAFFAKEAQMTKEELLEENNLLKSELQELLKHQSNISQTLRESNPFYILGAYPEIGLDYVTPSYDIPNYGFKNDDDYCELVDSFNLAHQENIFELKNFFTDYVELSLVRVDVMKKVGRIYADGVERRMEANGTLQLTNHFDHRITSFFLNNGKFHSYHKIGQHFLCATQIYNHIPGNSAATNKLKLVNHLHNYNAQYKNKRHCFNKDSFFPPTYRLQNKEECEEFFDIIQSKAYKELIKHEPIKYVIKSGKGVHKSDGVFLLDDEMTEKLNSDYDYGQNCGKEKQSFIAQTYIGNPLLLENDNKFDFRVFMLVASTNPLIVYYHDGFLRVSLNAYDKTSSDRATHLTNSAIANKLIKEAKQEGKSVVNNMTMEEIEESRSWDLEKLQEYLLEKNLIEDSNWLDNYLRPGFKKAFVHLTRMTHHAFWNQSNVYELQGVDFILDDKLKLWFIESNSSPFFNGKKRLEFFSTMLLDMFEIQYAYYRSRMQRIVKVISAMQKDTEGKNIEKWRKMYQEAARNRLESEYQISKNNSFSIVVDENLPGSKAYFGIISSECL